MITRSMRMALRRAVICGHVRCRYTHRPAAPGVIAGATAAALRRRGLVTYVQDPDGPRYVPTALGRRVAAEVAS